MIRTFLCILAIFLSARTVAATRADDGPIEVDFSPLPGADNDTEYRLRLVVKMGGKELDQEYKIGKRTNTADVAELIRESLPDGFDVKLDGAKLVINTYDGKPIDKLTITATGLPKGADQPKVRRLPK
jgi:hypothetical protein